MTKLFTVYCHDYGTERADGLCVRAIDAQDAAQNWAEWHDYHSAEYSIVGGKDVTVHVWDGAQEKTFVVSGESVPVYRARTLVLAGEKP